MKLNLKRYITTPVGLHSLTFNRPMADYEVATMALSALAYRVLVGGKMILATDQAGYEYVTKTGLDALYDEIRVVTVPDWVDTQIFWAAGKIFALSQLVDDRCPVVSIDLDAVLNARLNPLYDLHILHKEPQSWDAYRWNPMWQRLASLTATDREIELPPRWVPYNTAVAGFFCNDLLDEYVRVATKMMRNPPRVLGVTVPAASGKLIPVTAMVTAEQLALSAVAQMLGSRVAEITKLDTEKDHPAPSAKVFHLWNSKRFYDQHGRAREAYLTTVMEEIYQIILRAPRMEMAVQQMLHATNLPTIRVVDGNVGAVRWSHAGEWIGPGEEVVRL
jgi:hypothetical protein